MMDVAASTVKVLVVDDSAFMRKIIGDILESDRELEVVARARNGHEALKMFEEFSPDVVTLDVEMPGMNGIDVLKNLMARRPVPVVMVSGLTKQGADITMQALDCGAVDFVTKPSGTISLDMEKVGGELRRKVLAAAKATIRKPSPQQQIHAAAHLPPRTVAPAQSAPSVIVPQLQKSHSSKVSSERHEPPKHVELVAIGASTGGPVALQEVITHLPKDFPVPVAVVQHMPAGFTSSFAARLNERSELTVVEAEEGLPIRKGMVVIAPGGYHLLVEKKNNVMVCHLTETPPVRSVRPAADVLFKSVAESVGGSVIVAVLTGMGKDGLDGVRDLRAKGAYVVIESKETCVIYGMPGAIADAGLADEILPITGIAGGLVRLVK